MGISMIQAILLGLFACLASLPGMGGTTIGNYTLGRPLVGGLIVGLILGDIQTGIIVGASIQLVYIALVTPGGTVSADVRAVTYIGIPLAILFPDCQFKLIDGTGKKIRVAQEVCDAIGLKNCQPTHLRGEDEKGLYDFVVSRAVMPLPDLVKIVQKNISKHQQNALPNGILCLKGGDLQAEIQPYKKIVQTTEISGFFSEEWFKEKYVIYLPR